MWTLCVNVTGNPSVNESNQWKTIRLDLNSNTYVRSRLFLKSVQFYGVTTSTPEMATQVDVRLKNENWISIFGRKDIQSTLESVSIYRQVFSKWSDMKYFLGYLGNQQKYVDVEYRVISLDATYRHPDSIQFVFQVTL